MPTASRDITLPVGATIIIATFKIHRNEDVFPNPEVFNPDNFLPERSASRHYYAYVPFSAGPRSCVGKCCPQNRRRAKRFHAKTRRSATDDSRDVVSVGNAGARSKCFGRSE